MLRTISLHCVLQILRALASNYKFLVLLKPTSIYQGLNVAVTRCNGGVKQYKMESTRFIFIAEIVRVSG